jgi:hypothetical protein
MTKDEMQSLLTEILQHTTYWTEKRDSAPSLIHPTQKPTSLTALRQKMASYQSNGARLGWLLVPAERAVEIWEPLADPPAQPRRLDAATVLDADPHFPGLTLDLEAIWAG